MAIKRVSCFFEEFNISLAWRERITELATEYEKKSSGMMHFEDLKALGTVLIAHQPERMFEIGTFRGNSADFCLTLLPELRLYSIAYVPPRIKLLGKSYNNSHLKKEEVGAQVRDFNRSRFTQLYGDSHKLNAQQLVGDYGHFDLVLVDGDHTAKGVAQDTDLASRILKPEKSTICWHDANPKEKYKDVQIFLETQIPVCATATQETYLGGIAYWSGQPRELRS